MSENPKEPSSEPREAAEILAIALAAARVYDAAHSDHQGLADAANEIALRLLRYRDVATSSEHLQALAFKIARHLEVDRIRSRTRLRQEDLHEADAVFHNGERTGCPEAHARLATTLARAIDALPQDCREVIFLRMLRQLPLRAVAEHLKMPESTVRRRQAEAYSMLRALLRARCERDPELASILETLGYKPEDADGPSSP